MNAPKIELKEFEKDAKFFESCLPIEVLAARGVDTLRYGPMKPVGLVDKRTGVENYAVVQLRQDNVSGTMYNLVGFQTNLKWGSQKELLHSIPGLENANILRYGVMHRNTFINSPSLLEPTLQCRKRKDFHLVLPRRTRTAYGRTRHRDGACTENHHPASGQYSRTFKTRRRNDLHHRTSSHLIFWHIHSKKNKLHQSGIRKLVSQILIVF